MPGDAIHSHRVQEIESKGNNNKQKKKLDKKRWKSKGKLNQSQIHDDNTVDENINFALNLFLLLRWCCCVCFALFCIVCG